MRNQIVFLLGGPVDALAADWAHPVHCEPLRGPGHRDARWLRMRRIAGEQRAVRTERDDEAGQWMRSRGLDGVVERAIPNACVEVLRGAGHFPWFERPGCAGAALRRLTAIA